MRTFGWTPTELELQVTSANLISELLKLTACLKVVNNKSSLAKIYLMIGNDKRD